MRFRVVLKPKKASLKNIEAVFLPVWTGQKGAPIWGKLFSLLTPADQKLLKQYIDDRSAKGPEAKLFRLSAVPKAIFLVIDPDAAEAKLSVTVRRFVRLSKTEGFRSVALHADDFADTITPPRMCALVAGNAVYSHYDFSEEFKTPPVGGWKRVSDLTLLTEHAAAPCQRAIKDAEIVADGINQCRTLVNYPPSELKPEGLAEAARTVANELDSIAVTVFDEKRLKQEGMNAILSVGQGSVSAPRLIIMEYYGGEPKDKPLTLVGKGVTFDSGGLNLKPGESMTDMHMDMSGAAAVIHAVRIIAKLKLPINVVGIVPAVENMPSGISYRQGDIIRSYSGKTIEIGNTDAEGRVILADAIGYAQTKKPALIAEISTLTGAAEVALGQRAAALFVKNNKPLADELQRLGEESGDRIWPMPLWEEHEKDVEGNLADVTNTNRTGSRWGGAISGAAFLSHFAGKTPFVHIDMAPRMVTLPEEEQLSRGAAGFGVRLFVTLAMNWQNVQKLLK